MRKTVITVLLSLLVAAALLFYYFTRPLPILTVTTWPGPYGRAQAIAFLQPYGEKAGVNVHIAEWDGELAGLRRAVVAHSYDGDVIDFELPKAIMACREGLLEKIDSAMLPDAKDFVPGALGPCWVGSVVYSQAIIAAPGTNAANLGDFFDLAKFPGGRGLRNGPKYNLEMALLADGVAAPQVYAALSTDAGLARAFAKLDTIRRAIVWWAPGSEPTPINLVAGGRVLLSTILNGDIYDAATHHGAAVKVIWDRQLYELDVFGVPSGDPKKDMAMDFIRFATTAAPLAAVAQWVPYGPARRSSLAQVGKNPDLGIVMTPFLPTTPQNFRTAFAIDDSWWLAHDAQIEARWQAWLAAPQAGPR